MNELDESEADQVSQLIGDVYDAALDPTTWSSVLEKTCRYVQGAASMLLSQDSVEKSAEFHYSWGDDPEYSRAYRETYVKIKVYHLTPAELRVLMTIVEVGGVPEVAPVLGIPEATVKTHLQRVFEKTGTNRQADLVKLVAAHMSPLQQ